MVAVSLNAPMLPLVTFFVTLICSSGIPYAKEMNGESSVSVIVSEISTFFDDSPKTTRDPRSITRADSSHEHFSVFCNQLGENCEKTGVCCQDVDCQKSPDDASSPGKYCCLAKGRGCAQDRSGYCCPGSKCKNTNRGTVCE